jgi:hypothetical protein
MIKLILRKGCFEILKTRFTLRHSCVFKPLNVLTQSLAGLLSPEHGEYRTPGTVQAIMHLPVTELCRWDPTEFRIFLSGLLDIASNYAVNGVHHLDCLFHVFISHCLKSYLKYVN